MFAGLSYLAKSGLSTISKYEEVDKLAQAGLIDPVENLKNANVYIFHGKLDSVVPVGRKTGADRQERYKYNYNILCLVEAGISEDFYNNYLANGNNIEFKEIEDSEHNFVRFVSTFSGIT